MKCRRRSITGDIGARDRYFLCCHFGDRTLQKGKPGAIAAVHIVSHASGRFGESSLDDSPLYGHRISGTTPGL